MTPAVQQARDAAVAALRSTTACGIIAATIARDPSVHHVVEAIDVLSCYDDGLDLAALRALFLLGAALTAPPPTCAPGCVRLATDGPGHPGACSVPETGGRR